MQPSAVQRTVLIVNDNSQSVHEAIEVLRSNGYEVHTALSAEVASAAISKQPPDVILLDLNLPNRSAFSLISQIRSCESLRELSVILTFDRAEDGALPEALRLGANDYLARPIDPDLLVMRIQTLIDAIDRMRRLELRIQQLQKSGGEDEITGTPNRNFALKLLEAELRRGARYHRPLSLLVMDLDVCLGEVLDEESAGVAELLRHAATVLGYTLRSTDVLARFEGLRFFAVLPETTEHQAVRTAQRLREALECSPHRLEGMNIRIGLLSGASSFSGAGMPPSTKEMLARALQAMARSRSTDAAPETSDELNELANTVITPFPESPG